MPEHTLATIMAGPQWHARILAPGKAPFDFEPHTRLPIKVWLERAIELAYPDVEFVDEATFNRAVEEAGHEQEAL